VKVTHIEFSALFNLGDYNNERLGVRVQLEDSETVEEVMPKLRDQMVELSAGQGRAEQMYSDIYRQQRELRELDKKLQEATEQWNQVAEFLRAQGIKPDAPNLPTLPALAPGKPDEINAEFIL